MYFFRENTWRYRSTSKVTQLVASYQIVSDCGISNCLIIMQCVTSIFALPHLFICNIGNATSKVWYQPTLSDMAFQGYAAFWL